MFCVLFLIFLLLFVGVCRFVDVVFIEIVDVIVVVVFQCGLDVEDFELVFGVML